MRQEFTRKQRLECFFMEKVHPEPNTGCWLWTGTDKGNGYGMITVGGRRELAHRVSYRLYKSEIPSGMYVCHQCDTPSCVNPDHLWLGTQRENIRDCVAKGRANRRAPKGENHHAAKLTAIDVEAIRAAPFFYGAVKQLAEKYGVRPEAITAIRNGRAWVSHDGS